MKSLAYYNEFDPFAAAWLDELIRDGLIADGVVDTRSIADVTPEDLDGFTQCHFFAGIGGWSYALRLAGWPDDRPVWTGSCPCQPFSSAGKQEGVTDPRHLWPVWFPLIRECRPAVVFGEQVEAAIAHGWLDLVQDDLEGEGYAFGTAGLPAASVGAPHIRPRVWFVADAERERTRRRIATEARPGESRSVVAGKLAAATRANSAVSELADADLVESRDGGLQRGGRFLQPAENAPAGFWSDAVWLPCRDGKSRPVEPGTFPLAHGVSARVGRLRGYGNAIVPQVAAEVIRAYLDVGATR